VTIAHGKLGLLSANHANGMESRMPTNKAMLCGWLKQLTAASRGQLQALAVKSRAASSTMGKTRVREHFLRKVDSDPCFRAVLDDDAQGRVAVERALSDQLLTAGRYTIVACSGLKESELEDCYDLSACAALVREKESVDLNEKEFARSEV
jgi:hypothetical protein